MTLQNRTCILITGMGHSGTRLLVQMLAKHPDVAVPLDVLNDVQEYIPLHWFFVQAMDRTPLYSDEYWLDPDELAYILEAYIQTTEADKPYFVLKMPYYPLYYLDFFSDYFGDRLKLLFTRRPIEKVVHSWLKPGSNLFFYQFEEIARQAKKLAVAERQQILSELSQQKGEGFFHALETRCDSLRDGWNIYHPDNPFLTLDMEQLAKSRDYQLELINFLGLSTTHLDAMTSVIDYDRLLHNRSPASRSIGEQVKAVLRGLTPPVVWSYGSKLNRRLRNSS